MKQILTLLALLNCICSASSQAPITSVTTASVAAENSYSYTSGGNTYNWGLSPNNTETSLNGFSTGGEGYSYATTLPGIIKLRRVDNGKITGSYSVQWVEATSSGTTYNFFPAYQNDMESFLNSKTYNKGTDNLFDNSAMNSNNIERFDWIITAGYSGNAPAKAGFAVFDKGFLGSHDAFAIAAITSLNPSGDPLTYGPILRVDADDYGDPGPSVTYRIVKGPYASNLLNAGNSTQDVGACLYHWPILG